MNSDRAKKTRPITHQALRKLALALPGVKEGTSYGTRAWRVGAKFLARLREDGESLVVRLDFDERDALMEGDPKTFYITDHYSGYPAVLVRLSTVGTDRLRQVLREAWRRAAPKRLLKALDEVDEGTRPVPPRAQKESPSKAPRASPRKVGARGRDHLKRVRRICLALPETTEKEAWGAPTFRVRTKMFAMYVQNHHNDGRIALWCSAPAGLQAVLVSSEPNRFFVPPYVGPRGWIGVHLDRNDDARLAVCVREAYCAVAPKTLQAIVRRGDS